MAKKLVRKRKNTSIPYSVQVGQAIQENKLIRSSFRVEMAMSIYILYEKFGMSDDEVDRFIFNMTDLLDSYEKDISNQLMILMNAWKNMGLNGMGIFLIEQDRERGRKMSGKTLKVKTSNGCTYTCDGTVVYGLKGSKVNVIISINKLMDKQALLEFAENMEAFRMENCMERLRDGIVAEVQTV